MLALNEVIFFKSLPRYMVKMGVNSEHFGFLTFFSYFLFLFFSYFWLLYDFPYFLNCDLVWLFQILFLIITFFLISRQFSEIYSVFYFFSFF